MTTVLIVEDDTDLRCELSDYLSASDYEVIGVGTMAEAEAALSDVFDLLILDINLPDGCGMELCRRLRPYVRCGIVMCTGRSEREMRINSLRDGADAYLVKPVDPEELEATLISVLRRATSVNNSMLTPAPLPVQWRLDQTRLTLTAPIGTIIKLSQSETLLLASVLNEPNRQASRASLLNAFEGANLPTDGRRIEALISRLRGKVFERTQVQLPLESMYGKGYNFTDHAKLI